MNSNRLIWTAKLHPRDKAALRDSNCFPSFLLFLLTNALSVLIATPPFFIYANQKQWHWAGAPFTAPLVEDVQTKAVTSVGHRTTDGLGSWSQGFYEVAGFGKSCFFIQFLFTRLYSGFIVTVYLPGSQRHKYLVNGFGRPYCIPNSEQTEIANDLFFC